jgi:hypothetical protein
MRHWILALTFTITAIGPVAAQTTRELAYQLAEISLEDSFAKIKPEWDGKFDDAQRHAANKGLSDQSLEILFEEMKNAGNRENLIKVIAEFWAREMTREELQQALDFTKSPAGKKFRVVSQFIKEPRNVMPILLDACSRARERALNTGTNTNVLDAVCSQFR